MLPPPLRPPLTFQRRGQLPNHTAKQSRLEPQNDGQGRDPILSSLSPARLVAAHPDSKLQNEPGTQID